MGGEISAQQLALSLVKQTIPTIGRGVPNHVLAIQGPNLVVATSRSPEGAKVPLKMLGAALDRLVAEGELRIEPETFGGRRRSSFIGAALATLDGVIVDRQPARIRLTRSAPLQDVLTRACRQRSGERSTDMWSSQDRLSVTIEEQAPPIISGLLASDRYKVQGSTGQRNFQWAETPWVAVFDRFVTETAQDGYYVVYLVRSDGAGVYLTINQGGTMVPRDKGASRIEALQRRGMAFRAYLGDSPTTPFDAGPIYLGGVAYRTRWYEAGSVLARYYPASAIPHDVVLASDLQVALHLYRKMVDAAGEIDAATDPDLPKDARSGAEAKRYRWHLQAEGRNRSMAKAAKRLKGYKCEVCDRNFTRELGAIGKRCIDAHHLVPFKDLDEQPKQLDPEKDFAVVCANCHRILHSETPPLEIKRARDLIKSPSKKATTGIEPV